MKSRFKNFNIIFLYLLALVLVLPTAFSDWVMSGNNITEANTKIEAEDKTACCYINEDKNRRYMSIEDALTVTNNNGKEDTIYVFPCKTIISRDCFIDSGDTLKLVYDNDGGYSKRDVSGDFADSTENSILKNKKVDVTIASGVTLTNYGNLLIGGQLGTNGIVTSGQTTGLYCQISMDSNSKIVNEKKEIIDENGNKIYGQNPVLECYGYIKEKQSNNGSIVTLNDCKLSEPMVIYDFKGGNYSLKMYLKKVFPFTTFDFPNIQVQMDIDSSSIVNLFMTFNVNSTFIAFDDCSVLSNNDSSLFKFSNKCHFKYNPTKWSSKVQDFLTTRNESVNQSTKVDFIGNAEVGGIKVNAAKLFGVDLGKLGIINSVDYYLPISYKLGMSISNGQFLAKNKMRFLPGSSITVKRDASIKCSTSCMFYSEFTDKATHSPYPNGKPKATLNLDGSAELTSDFGGIVLANLESAQIITSTSFGNETSNKEMNGDDDISHSEIAKFTLIDKKSYDPNSETNMLYSFSKDENSFDTDTIQKGTTYTSYKLSGYDKYGWYAGDTISNYRYGIRYTLNSDTASNPNSYIYFDTNESGLVLKPLLNSNSSLKFDGFYYSSDFSASSMLEKSADGTYVLNPETATNYLNGKNYVMLYAKWIDSSKAVTIQFKKYVDDVLVDSVSYSGMVGEAFDLSVCKDTERADTVVENVSKVTYSFKNWIVKDSNGNVINVSNNTFVPQTGNSIYYVEPEYDSTNYLALIVTNHKYTGGYSIGNFSISGVSYSDSIKDNDQHAYFVKSDDYVDIGVSSPWFSDPKVYVTIGDDSIEIQKGKSTKIQFNVDKYVDIFKNLKGPITIVGK